MAIQGHDELLYQACQTGDLKTLKSLLKNKNLCIDIHHDENRAVITACRHGQVAVLDYLASSHELKSLNIKPANIHAQDDKALKLACKYGHLEVVRYLLTSNKLTTHANIHVEEDFPLRTACVNGHLDIVQYLLSSQELSKKESGHANVHARNDEALKLAHLHGQDAIVQHLLLTYKMAISSQLIEYAAGVPSLNDILHKILLHEKFNGSMTTKPYIRLPQKI